MDGTMNIGSPDLAGLVLEQKTRLFQREAPHSTPEEAGRKMEALFATMLVKELRKTLPNEGFFGSGPGADTFNGMLDEQIGEQLANSGALNIAGQVKVALMNAQQNAQQNTQMNAQQNAQLGAQQIARQNAQHNAHLGARQDAQHNAHLGARQDAQQNAHLGAQQDAQQNAHLGAQRIGAQWTSSVRAGGA